MKLFFLNYDKEGKGVSKDAPPKEGLELFFDIFMREFTSLIKLNLLFILSCIPIITIGPAIGAITAVTVKMVQDKPSDLAYDFRKAFVKNWKSSFLLSVITFILILILIMIMNFCISLEGIIYNIMISFIIVISILLGVILLYIYPMSVSVDLSLNLIIKNSFLLSILQIKYSLTTFIICIGLIEISYIFMPISLFIIIFFLFSFISFISSFCAWSGIRKYIIKERNTKKYI